MKRIFVLLLTFMLLTTVGGAARGNASMVPASTSSRAMQNYQGPLAPPASGYGRWGEYGISEPDSFSVQSQGYANPVTVYFPQGVTSPAPVIFLAPGWEIPCDAYAQLLRFLTSRGYVSVCAVYHTDTAIIGAQLYDDFSAAVARYPDRIDASQFGLAGHSSGAGLLPSLSYRLVRENGWGDEGKFIFSSAPWIDFDIDDAMLQDYPTDMKFILQTYEDDKGTDLRTYIQQFEELPIPDTEKEYITLRDVTIDGYHYAADHRVTASGEGGYGVWDAMDYYGVYRLIAALADYAFEGSAEGKRVALGDGNEAQVDMGPLRDLISTDDPRPIPGESYDYPCDVESNPHKDHCADFDHELPAAVLLSPWKHVPLTVESPEFRWETVPTATTYFLQVRPLLPDGDPDWSVSYGESAAAAAAGCEDGGQACSFQLSASLPGGSYVWWIKAYSAEKEGVWSRRGYFQIATNDHTLFLPLVAR